VSPAKKDLQKNFPLGNYTKDTDGLISQLIIDYCDYITEGTLTDGADLGTVPLGGRMTLELILDHLASIENWVWYLTPTGQLYFNNGTVDTLENFTEDSDIYNALPTKSRATYNKVKVTGAYIGGVLKTSDWIDDLESQQAIGINKFEVSMGFLNTDALCTTAATNLLARLGKVPKEVNFNHQDSDVGFMQPGETITFEFVGEGVSIPSDQFIINAVVYDHLSIGNYDISDELL
jgi:hypothetical protein